MTLLHVFVFLLTMHTFAQTTLPPGHVCENPIQITSFPFITSDNTGTYGNNYSGTVGDQGCGVNSSNNFLNGNEVFYSFTATDDTPVSITLSSITAFSGIFVYDSCDNIGVNCIAGAGNNLSNDRNIYLPVIEGQTYYIVISRSITIAQVPTLDYELKILKLSCTDFDVNYSVISDCENGNQFYVTADITEFGSATSINLTSNQNDSPLIISSTGTVELGPYTNGTIVVLNLQNSNDPNCYSISPNLTQLFCPATNDLCQDAIMLTCGSTEIQTLTTATNIGTSTACGESLANNFSGLWYTFMGTGDLVKFSLCESTSVTTTNINIFKGSCQGFVCEGSSLHTCNNKKEYRLVSELDTLYYIYISKGINTTYQGHFSLNVTCETPPEIPSNDECQNAIEILPNLAPSIDNFASGTFYGATSSGIVNSCSTQNFSNDDVWFKFTATNSDHNIEILNITGENVPIRYALYSTSNNENSCENLNLLNCTNSNSSFSNDFIVGQTYYIQVFSRNNLPLIQTNFDIRIISTNAIIIDTTTYTVNQLIEEVLFNDECTSISNITWSTGTNFESVNGIGYFEKGNTDFPFAEGIVISTGNVLSIATANVTSLSEGGQNWPGDSDINAITASSNGQQGGNSMNASIIEFDFIPQNNFMSFDFLFASEEYGSFQCQFADAFAFLLTDVETGETTNLAVVPGSTDPISVVTIRNQLYNAGCPSVNQGFFDVFYGPNGTNPYLSNINFNGVTKPMTASSLVVPNKEYRIKLVIADRLDAAFDSAIFIEGGSFALDLQCEDVFVLEAFIDENNNGVKDDNEVSFSQGNFEHTANNATPTNVSYSPAGIVLVPAENDTDSFNFSFQVFPEMADYFSCSTTYQNINFNELLSNTYYFPVINTQPFNEVEVNLTAVGSPNPGFAYSNKIIYKNNGILPASGTITYVHDTPLTMTSVSQTGIVFNNNGFSYEYSNLMPNETRIIHVGLQTPLMPLVAINDLLSNNATITAANDINPNNNQTTLIQAVVASYDPNDKMESHGNEIDIANFSSNDYLYYTIRFQNTGTANAQTVIITDLLDSQLDEESLRMISASHHYTLKRLENSLEWEFSAINLVPQLVSEEESQGYILFKIKLKPGFAVGDIVPNTAQIYFDFNEAIVTNTFETEFITILSNADFTENNVLIYPNPANEKVFVKIENSTDAISQIRLLDALGKVVFQNRDVQNQTEIDISGLSKGVYLIEISTLNEFRIVKKLVKN